MRNSYIFRKEAVDAYMNRQREIVLPPTVNGRVVKVLWLFAVLMSVLFFVLGRVSFPEYLILPVVRVELYDADQIALAVSVPESGDIQTGRTVIFTDGTHGTVMATQSIGSGNIIIIINRASNNVFAAPSVVYIEVGARRLGSYLPLLGGLFQ